jgi:hypothetical protein
VLYISNEIDGSDGDGKLGNDSVVVGNYSNECEEAESTDYEDEHSTKQ